MESEGEQLLRQRYVATDWDPDLPYGGKVFLARKKKPDPLWMKCLEALAVISVFGLVYYSYYHFDHMHFHVTKAYAHMGFTEAEHIVGQRYLHGKGVRKDPPEAMKWFHKAAKKGHTHAAYNVAVGHINGIPTQLNRGEVRQMLHHAAENGVQAAHVALNQACSMGKCDD